MAKAKMASDWLAACSGCHMSFLDMDEKLIDLLKKVELTATPITDLKVPSEEGVDVGMLEGAVNNDDNAHVAERMRARCKVLVAIGDCAVFGGIIGMREFWPTEEALRRSYEEESENGQVPDWPDIMRPIRTRPLDEVVKVDVYVPGCPPRPEMLYYVLSELAEGRIPKVEDDKLTYD